MSNHPAIYYKRHEEALNNDPIQFFGVNGKDVASLLTKESISIPDAVSAFWSEVGYGFVNASVDGSKTVDWTNLIMSPIHVGKTLKSNKHARGAVRDDVPRIPIFMGGEDALFCISMDGKISYLRDHSIVIAEGLDELVEKLLEDPDYFASLAWPDCP